MLQSIALLFLFTSARAVEPACPDPLAELGSAENDIVSFFLSDAETSLAEAVDAFGCSRLATAEDVARLLLAKGMILRFQEDLAGAERAFASARAVSPETYNEDYGDEVKAVWASSPSLDGKPALVAIRNLGAVERLWLDGTESAAPLKVAPGLHLLQAGAEVPRFARLLDVAAADELTVTLPALDRVEAADASLSAGIERNRNFVPALVTGGAAALLYGGAIGMRQVYDSSPSDGGMIAVNGLFGGAIATGVAAGSLLLVQLTKRKR